MFNRLAVKKMEQKNKMISNVEIFFNFLAENYSLTDYIVAYMKHYNICNNPLYARVKSKANSSPKGLFKDILGSGHKFKELEKKWLEYVENSIDYIPERDDFVYCAFFDDKTCTLTEWISQFWEGTKEEFTDINGLVFNKQTFLRKATETEINNI